jgi:hypothetical protein
MYNFAYLLLFTTHNNLHLCGDVRHVLPLLIGSIILFGCLFGIVKTIYGFCGDCPDRGEHCKYCHGHEVQDIF